VPVVAWALIQGKKVKKERGKDTTRRKEREGKKEGRKERAH